MQLRHLWKFYFVSTVVFMVLGVVFSFTISAVSMLRVKCGDGLFYWQVLFSHILLIQSVLMCLMFFLSPKNRSFSVANASRSSLVVGGVFCFLLVLIISDAVVNYDFQCVSAFGGGWLRYVVFTLGMNIFHFSLFFVIFSTIFILKGARHE